MLLFDYTWEGPQTFTNNNFKGDGVSHLTGKRSKWVDPYFSKEEVENSKGLDEQYKEWGDPNDHADGLKKPIHQQK